MITRNMKSDSQIDIAKQEFSYLWEQTTTKTTLGSITNYYVYFSSTVRLTLVSKQVELSRATLELSFNL